MFCVFELVAVAFTGVKQIAKVDPRNNVYSLGMSDESGETGKRFPNLWKRQPPPPKHETPFRSSYMCALVEEKT